MPAPRCARFPLVLSASLADARSTAQQHSHCVDSAKSGTFIAADEVRKPPLRGRPDFLSTLHAKSNYMSPKVLGQLYRNVDEKLLTIALPLGPYELVDPNRSLTSALSALVLAGLPSSHLPRPSTSAVAHYRRLITSFSLELTNLASLSVLPRAISGGRPPKVSEEELFLGVTSGSARLDRSDKTAQSRRKEQSDELFSLARRLIRDGEGGWQRTSTVEALTNAWSAWMAAVEEGEDRGKTATRVKNGGKERIGLRTFAWLAMGVLTEQLERLRKKQVEVLVIE